MRPGASGPAGAAARLVASAVGRWRAGVPGLLVVAIDGHGAAGKSTLAAAVAGMTGAALVHTDDFFQPLPARRPRRPVALACYYDWRRLRAEALEPLRAGRGAEFRRFDWERGEGLDGRTTVAPTAVLLMEGVFSAAPELSDLVDRAVFVATPPAERLRRLRAQLTPEEWDDDWLAAEQAYFGAIRPPSSFDLVVPGTSAPPGSEAVNVCEPSGYPPEG
jgi:uridine kinase